MVKLQSMPKFNVMRSLSTEVTPETSTPVTMAEPKSMMDRFIYSAEVTVSKIFPAGFGWQTASVVAEGLGYGANDMGFFLVTGAGDMAGVVAGHTLYYTMKSFINSDIKVKDEAITGLWLGSAAFCSGFAWQPVVNTLQAASIPFIGVAGGTVAGCGLAFFAGLRIFRLLYSPLGVPAMDNANFTTDAQLSLAIGGATGAFVGTDVAYLNGDGNFLRPLVGIEEGMSDLQGSITAGTSTGIGFVAFQSVQNVSYEKGTNWTD